MLDEKGRKWSGNEKVHKGWDGMGNGRRNYISELISVHCLSDMWDASESMMSNSSGWLSDRRLGSLDTFREGRRTKEINGKQHRPCKRPQINSQKETDKLTGPNRTEYQICFGNYAHKRHSLAFKNTRIVWCNQKWDNFHLLK